MIHVFDTPEDLRPKSLPVDSFIAWSSVAIYSVWFVGESLLDPLDGVTEQKGLVLFLHLLEGAALHLLLEEVEDLDLELRVQLSFLEHVQLQNDLVQRLNLQLHSVGRGGTQEGSEHVLHHFRFSF